MKVSGALLLVLLAVSGVCLARADYTSDISSSSSTKVSSRPCQIYKNGVALMYCPQGCFFGTWSNDVFTWMVCASGNSGRDSGQISLTSGTPKAYICTGDNCVNDTR